MMLRTCNTIVTSLRSENGEGLVQIGDQIVGIFQPDMQPHQRPAKIRHADRAARIGRGGNLVGRSGGKGPAPAVTDPSMTSEWPTTYLVQASTVRSMPWAIAGNSKGVAQVLSRIVVTPRSLATATIAGISCTSNVR